MLFKINRYFKKLQEGNKQYNTYFNKLYSKKLVDRRQILFCSKVYL